MKRIASSVLALSLAVGAAGCGDDPDPAARADGDRCRVPASDSRTMWRVWNEAALDAIRLDFPAPTVHARNLYHLSAAMWDVWRAYADDRDAGSAVYVDERRSASDVDAARDEAMAFAAHRILRHRYELSLSREETLDALDGTLAELCPVADPEGVAGDGSAAEFGLAVADAIIEATQDDGSLEHLGYEDDTYLPVNPPLIVSEAGTVVADPDRWQPLILDGAVSQNGIPLDADEQTFVGSQWGSVTPFALDPDPDPEDRRGLPIDPGPPPSLTDPATADQYRAEALDVLRASSELEVGAATIDISPGALGDNSLGVDDGDGHEVDPATGAPYPPNVVDAADYYRAIAEYWADGPTSETPPGHWNVLANAVSDRLDPPDRLAWDTRLGLVLNGALHDAAIAAWGAKAHYDYVRPITMIRWLAREHSLPLVPGLAEEITEESSAPGERHEELDFFVGEIAVRAWRGSPEDPESQTSGVGWIRAARWVPYQRATFVTPAFAAYVSGHSTFSRAAAEVLAGFTGSPFFPGGIEVHEVGAGSFLHEEGPSETFELQWATYYDAADEAGRSRIWGGIHVASDDRAGRIMGAEVGRRALDHARELFGEAGPDAAS